jgi:regulator of protease activity HflC (stomatin/prohibitin superfamily)
MKYKNEDGIVNVGKAVLHGVLGVIGLVLLIGSFTVVGAGQRGVVLTLGKVSENVWSEGLHFKIPFIQSVQVLDVKTQVEGVDATAASRDLQNVSAKVALNYHLDAERVDKLWQSLGANYKERVIDPAIQESVKAVTAQYTAEELITKRPLVKDDIKKSLTERLQKEFIIVDEFSIVNFDFSQSFNQAIEAKVTAEQNALAAKNKLEQVKYEKEQRIAEAQGEAEAIRIQAQAIQNQGGAEYVNLKAIEKWNGILPTQLLSNTVPFIEIK